MKKLSQDQLAILAKPLPPEALKAHPTKKDSSGTPMTTIKAIVVLVGSSQCLDLINHRRNVQGFGPIDNTESFLYNAGQEYLKSFYNIQVVHSLKFSTLANPDLFCEQQVPGMKQLLGLELPGDQIYNIINHWRVKNFGEIDK